MKALWLMAIFVIAGCSFPRDPEKSYDRAGAASLLVGVAVNPPHTTFEDGKAGGREVELLREFAAANDLKITFREGSESVLIEKLKNYKLHILAGGFDKKTIWEKDAGTTVTYDKQHLFLIPRGENKLLQKLETFILQNPAYHEGNQGL